MAWISVYSFNYSGTDYFVQWEDVMDIGQCVDGSGNVIPVVTLTELELGVSDLYTYYSACKGPDLYQARAAFNYPFFFLDIVSNSPSCVVTVCDLQITGIDVTDESATGLNDGTATINATSTVTPIYYSLDGLNWQTSNFFFGLHPGTYYGYAKTGSTCQKQRTFSVAASVTAPQPAYPSLDRVCHFFRLIYNGVTYDIEEPVRWDNVNFVGSRSKEWHTYRGMWSDGVIELEFDCYSGMDVLETAYGNEGSDAVVLFQYGYTYQGNDYVLFPGKLNFNTRKKYPQKVSMSVEKEDFNQSLLTRFDTKVSLADTVGYDGAAITPPSAIETTLHAKEIVRNFKVQSTDVKIFDISAYQFSIVSAHDEFYIHPDTNNPNLNEIEESYPKELQLNIENPVSFDLYNLVAKYSGTYEITIEYSLELNFSIFNDLAIPANYTIQGGLKVNSTDYAAMTPITGVIIQNTINQPFTNSLTITLPINAGDKIYFYSQIHFDRNVAVYGTLKQTNTNILLKALESTAPTSCKAWFIYDVINHCSKVITNNEAVVKSSFLSLLNAQQATDGSGSLYLLTNGKQIRQFAVDTSPLVISLKDALTSAKNTFCLGYNLESAGSKDVVRIERANYFYRDREILVIEECSDYYEDVAKDLLYNEIEIGYEKYQDSGFNTLDEFNTVHQYLTPIKTNKLKLPAKSGFIASGYSIETSRRQQFTNTATDSYQNDDEAFIISVRRSGADFIPEKDEAFQTVTNIISSTTAYNLRLSPLRMLLNWAIWLKGVFFFKQDTEKIKSTDVKQNGDLITEFLSTEPNPIGDINRLQWQEKQDIELTNYDVEEKLYRPEYVYFKCRLTPDKIQTIDKCMRGADGTNDYGYILVKDKNGNYQAGFLFGDNCIEYNYATEKASFKLLKKWDSPVLPGASCCPYLVINGCYININSNKLIV